MKKTVAVFIVLAAAGCAYYAIAAQEKQGAGPSGRAAGPTKGVSGQPAESQPQGPGSSSRTAEAHKPVSKKAATKGQGLAAAAMKRAADARKHLFILFYEKDDKETRAVRKTVRSAMRKMARTAQWIAIDKNAASEKKVVEKFGVKTAPMPLVLAVAPNGAITGGFLGPAVTVQKLQGAIASQGMQKCLKALQARKLVFLCLQNGRTKANGPAMEGVRDFKADPRFGQVTEIVMLDPADKKEAAFLGKLQVEPKSKEAITVLMVPPGMIAAKFAGATNKAGLLATIQRACGPSGCGPSGCK